MFNKKTTGYQPPEYRKPSPPPPPTSGSNAVKPPNVGSSVQVQNESCTYSTPCGWCTKWDKKCDKKIGGGNDTQPRKTQDAVLEQIKSGKGLDPIDTHSASMSGIRIY